jgi:hypothetical protein
LAERPSRVGPPGPVGLVASALVARRQREPGEHSWVADRCRHCRLIRREAWVAGDDGPVLALSWVAPSGEIVRLRPFPPLLGVAPEPGTHVLDVPPELVGGEPPCPNDPALW